MRYVRPAPGMGAGRTAAVPAFATPAEQRKAPAGRAKGRAGPGTGVFPAPVAAPRRGRPLLPIPDEIAGYVPKCKIFGT